MRIYHYNPINLLYFKVLSITVCLDFTAKMCPLNSPKLNFLDYHVCWNVRGLSQAPSKTEEKYQKNLRRYFLPALPHFVVIGLSFGVMEIDIDQLRWRNGQWSTPQFGFYRRRSEYRRCNVWPPARLRL